MTNSSGSSRFSTPLMLSAFSQGLALAHFSAQREELRDGNTSLPFELNLSTFWPRPRVKVGCNGGQSELELSRKRQCKLKLSENGNECKPLP